MTALSDAWAWLTSAINWQGPQGIGSRLIEHLGYSVGAVAIAAVIAVPLGWYVGHTGRFRSLAVGLTSGMRSVPTLGVITLFALALGVGLVPPMVALVVLAIPSLLAGAYAGFDAVDRHVIDAARSTGYTETQILTRVEIPLGLPILVGGIRAATLQVISTATLAAYVGAGGLGRFLFLGLNTRNDAMILGTSILVAALAICLELGLAGAQRLTIAEGVRALRAKE